MDDPTGVAASGALGVITGAFLQFGMAWLRTRRGHIQDEHDQQTAAKLLEHATKERVQHRADIVELIRLHRDETRELRLTFERGIALVVSELKAAIAGCEHESCPFPARRRGVVPPTPPDSVNSVPVVI